MRCHEFKTLRRHLNRHGVCKSPCKTAQACPELVSLDRAFSSSYRINFAPDATVLVTVAEQKFVAHKDVLIRTSTFFKSALTRNGWREAQQRVVSIADHDATAFSIYLNWLHHGTVDVGDCDSSALWTQDGEIQESEVEMRYQHLVDCERLGDYIGDDRFRNALVDSYFQLRNATQRWPKPATCNQAHRDLPETSKLRLLILHHIAFGVDREAVEEQIDELDPGLVKDVALTAIEGLRDEEESDTPWERGRRFYHIGQDGEASGVWGLPILRD